MASSNPLRPQNRTLQNQTGILKQQEVNKQTAAVGSSKRGSENLDPNASDEAGKGVKLKGVSRLPVLAKSLQPAGNDLSQQNRWEQRPLTGKAQKKRICTKPVPFNLSQSRTHGQRNADVPGGKAPLTPARLTPGAKLKSHTTTPSGVFRSANNSQSVVPRAVGHVEHTTSTKPTSLDSTDGRPTITVSHESISRSQTDLSSRLGSITLVQSKLPEDLSHLCKDSPVNVGVGSSGQAPKDKNCIQTKAMHRVLSCEGSNTVGAQSVMPRLSTCPSGPGSSNNLPQRVSVKKSQRDVVNTTGNAGVFSPDPSALRSVLQNDAMRVVERVGATPRTSTCPTGKPPISNYSVQRVPVRRKPQTDDVAADTGSSVSFSPDPSALHSILQNEGVRVGALGGATPRVSTCPTGRGTSIYSAQRVPVKKTKTEATGAFCANRTPVKTWTPQRVANTKPQSMRKLLTAQKMSLFRDSPGFSGPQDPGTELLMHEEEDVVQRLFDDPEQLDNDHMDKNDVTLHQLPTTSASHQTIEPLTNKENSDSRHRHTEGEGKKTGQPFIQAAHRGSVIVFSSSQRLFGSDRPQEPPVIGNSTISHITLQSNQSNGSQVTSSSDMTKRINICTQSQLKASVLRRRHTLEEMILDEECATYTSRLLSCPLQPRCGNPVATTLLFQDCTCFLPIGLSSPVPPGSSIRA